MGFFSRRRPQPASAPAAPTAPPDLASLVVDALRRRGLDPVQLNAGEIAVGDHTFYLENLAHRVRGASPDEVTAEVERWVGIMTAPAPSATETFADVAPMLLPRILHRDMFGGSEQMAALAAAAARLLTPDLYLLPAIDRPDKVETVTRLEDYGGWEQIWPVALANLRALPAPGHQVLEPERGREGTGTVHVFQADDFFGATRLLVVEDVLAHALGRPVEAPHGMLVALPARGSMAVHVIDSAPGVMLAIRALVFLARADVEGPLLDQVLYRSPDGALQQITVTGEDGGAVVQVQGRFEEVLRTLGAL